MVLTKRVSRFGGWAASPMSLLLAVSVLFFVIVPIFFYDDIASKIIKSSVAVYEKAMFSLAPTPERASFYGLRHFQSENKLLYDIDQAEFFYKQVEHLSPAYPYVNHQLARIAFLKGDFSLAMLYINREIAYHGPEEPNTYYVRGLIEGYRGDYDASIADYAHFLKDDPYNWATMNDYAWVLLKANKPREAAEITLRGLGIFPGNPWLLNSRAIALFELKKYKEALPVARLALEKANQLSETRWSQSYPGNDPMIAGLGVATFRAAAANNVHSIERAIASSTQR